MDINQLREKVKDPVVRDHKLIEAALKEFIQLPASCLFMDNIMCNKKPYRSTAMNEFSKILNKDPNDDLFNEFGSMLETINDFKGYVNTSNEFDYNTILYLLAMIYAGFSVDTIEVNH